MLDLTEAPGWLRTKTGYKSLVIRPAMAADDIDGAFNCACHNVLNRILTDYRFPKCLVECIQDFNSGWKIQMAFDGEAELPAPFESGLPQGSPLSPILFVFYAGTLNSRISGTREQTTAYVDDEIMVQGATSQILATRRLQERLHYTVNRAKFLNIKYSRAKTELMHLLPFTSGWKINNSDTTGLTLYGN